MRCGVRREVAACLERVRIVGGDEAGCNEWPWQVTLLCIALATRFFVAGGSFAKRWVGDPPGAILWGSPGQQQAQQQHHHHYDPTVPPPIRNPKVLSSVLSITKIL